MHQCFRNVANIGQSASRGFLFPFFGVTVAFETDWFGSDDCFFQQPEDGFVFSYSVFHQFLYRCTELVQLICHGSVDSYHCGSAVGRRTCGAEFETISGESERRSTVAVGCIEQNLRNTSDTQFQCSLFFRCHFIVSYLADNFIESGGELRTQKAGQDGGRSFVGPQTVAVAGTHDGGAQQVLVLIDHHQYVDEESQE